MHSTIQRLYGVFAGATISIVGSGRTALTFRPEECDVSIGINGAALLGPRFDYFLCMAPEAPERDWFYPDCSDTRIIESRIAPFDHRLYPKSLSESLGRTPFYEPPPDLPEPAGPHHIFVVEAPSEQGVQALLQHRSEALMTLGTVAGQAVQLAFLMGASVIRLHGCSFSEGTTGRLEHYFYPAPQGQTGWITPEQIHFMELYLSLVRHCGTRIVIHGDSALREFDQRVSPL